MSGRAGSWSAGNVGVVQGHVPMGRQERRQVAGDGRVGGVGQAELLKARAAAGRPRVQRHAREEAVDQQVADLLAA